MDQNRPLTKTDNFCWRESSVVGEIGYRETAKIWRVMTAAMLILGMLLIVGTGALFAISPGQPPPLRDDTGQVIARSLSERVTIEIGGIPQSMFIQSVDATNPVLLFLHGGPGMVEFFMEQ